VRGRGRPPLGALPVEDDTQELLDLWTAALDAPLGIVIESQRPNALVQKLYAARRLCGHTAYMALKLVEEEDKVWIIPR